MPEVRWLDEDELRAWAALQMMQMRLNARLARDLAAHSSLGYQDYVVLVNLTGEADGRMRLFELAYVMGWERSRLSHHISRMVARGLVRKHSCASDGRGAFVEVSARGRRDLADAAPSHVDAVRRLFVDRLTRAQLRQLEAISTEVLAAIDAEDKQTCGEEAECDG